jgi:hypothetical protein
MAAPPFWESFRKKLFGTKVYPDQILRGAGQANARTGGMFKNPLGKMSPEELKDFQEVLKEMNLDMKPEFVAGGNYGRTQEYAHQPSLFNEATAAEYQKRKKLFPYV